MIKWEKLCFKIEMGWVGMSIKSTFLLFYIIKENKNWKFAFDFIVMNLFKTYFIYV